jgi:DNA cross-link repair 1A protein
MFRNPRENKSFEIDDRILPYIGRPPTPPSVNSTGSPYFTLPAKYEQLQQRSAAKQQQKSPTPMSNKTPILGRQSATKIPASAKKITPNTQSILNFFGKKSEDGSQLPKPESALFFKDVQEVGRPVNAAAGEFRFNENMTSVKRRRLDEDDIDIDAAIRTPSPESEPSKNLLDTAATQLDVATEPPKKFRGGFVDDSSDDEEDNNWTAAITIAVSGQDHTQDDVRRPDNSEAPNTIDVPAGSNKLPIAIEQHEDVGASGSEFKPEQDQPGRGEIFESDVPRLTREATSIFEPGDFGDEEFENEEFYEEGEEFLERRWMEEQREMGLTFDDEDSKSEYETDSVRTPQSFVEEDTPLECATEAESVTLCPICNGSMKGLSETQASSHVNACLDGTAEPLPKESEKPATTKPKPFERKPSDSSAEPTGAKRFQRAAIARPAQSNPFAMSKDSKGGSAFTRLMSGHAEDAAWAEAATNEAQSRGKPAYQRTCPFYKIMPGLYICVDAFRYGKVEGQNAYFLSHFHSDHYIGLTSSWCHGPIYASKVTCNLMVQQLRVDPKWVVPLEFEKTVEVPNTKGVMVTMIPANHCPGSSLYLFEKVTGKNKDGSPKSTRILHCGDFRACPAHVAHPLLRPDVVDSITGKTKQQTIDTCYLDTTYLTPKYAFPSQHDVIDACAKMCVSLSKDIVDSNDGWEKVKAERAGSVMKKFLEQGESELIKKEEENDFEEQKPKVRGRLLVVIGTYSIGKERICLGIARALQSKIYAPPSKMRICKALEDPELDALLTKNPLEAQVHMQTLMEIRAETLHDYLVTYKGHFARVVGFRPTGWSYRPPTSRFTENPAVPTVLHSEGWKTRYTMKDLAPQRGSTRESNCFGVPYSEHSSFRELTMFCCALRIGRIVPTVNVGSARSREKMKGWIEKWEVEKRKNGLYKVEVGAEGWGSGDGKLRYGV